MRRCMTVTSLYVNVFRKSKRRPGRPRKNFDKEASDEDETADESEEGDEGMQTKGSQGSKGLFRSASVFQIDSYRSSTTPPREDEGKA